DSELWLSHPVVRIDDDFCRARATRVISAQHCPPGRTQPSSAAEAEQNMRVEFRLIRVSAEVTQESDFDF
ncbi:MAG: hypothetical protein ACPHJZ_01360, partial [Limisphaerales bacterium]